MPRWNAILTHVDKLLFPPACLACNQRTDSAAELLCADCCSKLMPVSGKYCPHCGSPLQDYRCDACSHTNFSFDFARSAFVYDSPVKELVHRLKYESLRAPADFFARSLLNIPAAARLTGSFDLVMAVPLHHVRQRERGYNQSELIARRLASGLRIPFRKPVYRRSNTVSQTNLSREARISNLKGAFALHRKANIAGKRVILVDDVFTTGTTVNEISKLLKTAGVARVAVLTAARAV